MHFSASRYDDSSDCYANGLYDLQTNGPYEWQAMHILKFYDDDQACQRKTASQPNLIIGQVTWDDYEEERSLGWFWWLAAKMFN